MKILVIIMALTCQSAFSAETFFSRNLISLRPLLTKIFGEEKAAAWYGDEPAPPPPADPEESIKLPVIPKVQKSATSTETNTLGLSANSKYRFLSPVDVQLLNYNFLKDLYFAVRGQNPTDKEISQWLNTLEQGGSREGIYRAMVLDQNYAKFESENHPSSPNIIRFTIWFLERFIGQKTTAESVGGLNRYSLKRIITEKSLEIFDELKKKPEDFYNWYAVLSSEVATKYPDGVRGKMGKEKSKVRHKNWAKEMPEQHLKSELILKIHQVYNSIN